MTTAEIQQRLKDLIPYADIELEEIAVEPVLRISTETLLAVATALKSDAQLQFECLKCLSGVERGDQLQVVYHLYSISRHHHLTLRCSVPKETPVVPSLCGVWSAADWHEREAFDMLGVRFEHHPDLRRILCADDWEGHPLRKDYRPPEEFHGIPLTSKLPPEATA